MKKFSVIGLLTALCMIAGLIAVPSVSADAAYEVPAVEGTPFANFDFTENADAIVGIGSKGTKEHVNGAMKLTRTDHTDDFFALYNYGTPVNWGNWAVASMDVATEDAGNFYITGFNWDLSDSKGKALKAVDYLCFKADGKIENHAAEPVPVEGSEEKVYPVVGTYEADGTFTNVVIAVDGDAKTYSIWLNGEPVVDALALPENCGGLAYLRLEVGKVNDEASAGKHVVIDNLKVYAYDPDALVEVTEEATTEAPTQGATQAPTQGATQAPDQDPETGDMGRFVMWPVLMVACLMTAAVVVQTKKKAN